MAIILAACSNQVVADPPSGLGGAKAWGGETGSGPVGLGGISGGIILPQDASFEPDRPCTGVLCTSNPCEGKPKTVIKGTVYDPAAVTPLYNVMVYVPSTELDPIVDGPNCQRCDGTASGRPIATALSDATGKFVLDNAPAGDEIPVVVQTGKWRRKIVLPVVKPCQVNEFTDKNTFR